MTLLPRFFACTQRPEDLRRIGQLILEAGEVEDDFGVPLRRSADGHNADRLRGLPAIGRNVSGATHATHPVRALLAKEARGELRL